MVSVVIRDNSIQEENDLTFVNIKLGVDEFKIFLSNEEIENELKKYEDIGDNQYPTIYTLLAMNKLSSYLKISLDISMSKEVISY